MLMSGSQSQVTHFPEPRHRHRFGRFAGRVHGPGYSLSDSPPQHGTTDYRPAGHKHLGRKRFGQAPQQTSKRCSVALTNKAVGPTSGTVGRPKGLPSCWRRGTRKHGVARSEWFQTFTSSARSPQRRAERISQSHHARVGKGTGYRNDSRARCSRLEICV